MKFCRRCRCSRASASELVCSLQQLPSIGAEMAYLQLVAANVAVSSVHVCAFICLFVATDVRHARVFPVPLLRSCSQYT